MGAPRSLPAPSLPSRRSNFLKEQRRHLPSFPALAAAVPDDDHARARLVSARLPRHTGTVRAALGPLSSPRPCAPHEKGGKGRVLLAPLRTWRSPAPLSSLLRSHRPLARRHRMDAAPLLGSHATTQLFPSLPGSYPHFCGSSLSSPVVTPHFHSSSPQPRNSHPTLNGSTSSRYIRPSAAGAWGIPFALWEGRGRR